MHAYGKPMLCGTCGALVKGLPPWTSTLKQRMLGLATDSPILSNDRMEQRDYSTKMHHDNQHGPAETHNNSLRVKMLTKWGAHYKMAHQK